MQFEYIEENFNKIIQNPDSVMYLKPYNIGYKRALFAIVKEEQGIYKKIQVTKEQSILTFPYEPIFFFYKGARNFYLENFIVFNNWIALNITNLDGFKYKKIDNSKIFNIGIFATFNDGSATFIERKPTKEFKKRGGIQPYIDLLKQHKEYEPKHDIYEYIEYYRNNDDTFIIPELQEKTSITTDKPKTKTLKKDNNSVRK